MRERFRQVEGIDFVRKRFVVRHDLHGEFPRGFRADVDPIEEALRERVELLFVAADRTGGRVGERLHALLAVIVEFHPKLFVRGVVPHKRVRAIAVHVFVAGGNAAVTHEPQHLMDRFWRERPEIPLHGVVAKVGLRVPFLRVDEVGKFQRIADEEDRRVVADHIPVAFLGVMLDRKTAEVAIGIRAAAFDRDVREAYGEARLLADAVEEGCHRVLRHVVLEFEISESARALRMHHAFGNTLAIEVRVFLEQPRVLEK